jgi:hypothetical protein
MTGTAGCSCSQEGRHGLTGGRMKKRRSKDEVDATVLLMSLNMKRDFAPVLIEIMDGCL